MNMLRFTATASLYKPSRQYHAMGIGGADSSRATPQLAVSNDSALFCLAVCLCCGSTCHTWCCYKCDVCLGIWTAIAVAARLP